MLAKLASTARMKTLPSLGRMPRTSRSPLRAQPRPPVAAERTCSSQAGPQATTNGFPALYVVRFFTVGVETPLHFLLLLCREWRCVIGLCETACNYDDTTCKSQLPGQRFGLLR